MMDFEILLLIVLVSSIIISVFSFWRQQAGEWESPKQYDPEKENPLTWFLLSLNKLLEEIRPLVFRLMEEKTYRFAIFLRVARVQLSPNWHCNVCGCPLRYAFIPLQTNFIDAILTQDTGWLVPAQILCEKCAEKIKDQEILRVD